jgi:hypothetical protein
MAATRIRDSAKAFVGLLRGVSRFAAYTFLLLYTCEHILILGFINTCLHSCIRTNSTEHIDLLPCFSQNLHSSKYSHALTVHVPG